MIDLDAEASDSASEPDNDNFPVRGYLSFGLNPPNLGTNVDSDSIRVNILSYDLRLISPQVLADELVPNLELHTLAGEVVPFDVEMTPIDKYGQMAILVRPVSPLPPDWYVLSLAAIPPDVMWDDTFYLKPPLFGELATSFFTASQPTLVGALACPGNGQSILLLSEALELTAEEIAEHVHVEVESAPGVACTFRATQKMYQWYTGIVFDCPTPEATRWHLQVTELTTADGVVVTLPSGATSLDTLLEWDELERSFDLSRVWWAAAEL